MIQPLEQQHIINYLMWMKDRGLSYIDTTVVTIPAAIVESSPAPAPIAPQAAEPVRALKPLRVFFLSHLALTSSESEMVQRIGQALGLSAEVFALGTAKDLAEYEAKHVIALGDDTGHPSPLLVISHPRAMIKEPSLKASAWNLLQKLKAQL